MIVIEMTERPLLKGYYHLFATFIYLCLYPELKLLIPKDLKLSFTIYLVSIIGNFTCSASLHLMDDDRSEYEKLFMRKLDHVAIFILIASTYYAAISTIIYDINPLVIYTLIAGTIIGILIRLFYTDAPKIFISLPYFLIGWSILLDPYTIYKIIERIPDGYPFALAGGLAYSLGALVYTFEYPRLYPKIMGYHELFHIFTIIGTTLFAICLFRYGIPYHQSKN
jgi:hemolysin III